jgi:hypothetical protein
MTEHFNNLQFILNDTLCVLEIIEGEAIIINSDKGSYYNLPAQSTQIIESLLDGFTLEEIFKFNQLSSGIKNKIITLINKMLHEDILIEGKINKKKLQPNKLSINDENKDIHMEIYMDMKEMLELDPIHEADETVGWPKRK